MKRLSSKLTYANVVATLALFIALGGASYAATELPKNSVGTKQIEKEAITAAKIKNGTITGGKIAAGTITGSNLDLSSLGTVPTAGHASTADSANTAGHADTADSANTANSADTANSATTAADAQTLQGMSPTQISAEAKLSCPAGLVEVVGVCFESGPRPGATYMAAVQTCGNAGMVLPSFSDLASFDIVAKNETTPEWAGQIYADGTELRAEVLLDGGDVTAAGFLESKQYRCEVPPGN